MIVRINIFGRDIEITTEHPRSSYGQPVVLVDGELADGQVFYQPDAQHESSALDVLADAANVHDGRVTRNQLHGLAAQMLNGIGQPSGADYDRVIAEFKSRGRELAAAE